MRRDLLEAFGALAVAVLDEVHQRYPELLAARDPAQISDEALVAWRLLLGIEELLVLLDEAERRCVEKPLDEAEEPMLPF